MHVNIGHIVFSMGGSNNSLKEHLLKRLICITRNRFCKLAGILDRNLHSPKGSAFAKGVTFAKGVRSPHFTLLSFFLFSKPCPSSGCVSGKGWFDIYRFRDAVFCLGADDQPRPSFDPHGHRSFVYSDAPAVDRLCNGFQPAAPPTRTIISEPL